MELKAKWITTEKQYGDICPVFRKKFQPKKNVQHASLAVTARGVYEAQINGKRVGDFILAPGCKDGMAGSRSHSGRKNKTGSAGTIYVLAAS